MSETETKTIEPGTDLTPTQKQAVKNALALVTSGKKTLAEVLGAGRTVAVNTTAPKALAKTKPISDAQKRALALIPERFNSVVPTERRLLTPVEIDLLISERDVEDEVTKMASGRKEKIREALADHFDRQAEVDGLVDADTPRDKDGHYILVGTDRRVLGEESGKGFTFNATDPKPTISSSLLEKAHKDGTITREDYLKLTSLPTVPRVFDEDKARKAIAKEPRLMALLALAAEPAKSSNVLNITEKESA